MPALHLARFSSDVTPPIGHPLCGGWISPVKEVLDPQKAIGVVLLGMGKPVVLCAVDWCALRNEAHDRWRRALAEAAHTTPDHVAIQCIHQHDAPMADVEAERLEEATPGAPHNLDLEFFDRVVTRSAEALRAALGRTSPFNQVGMGRAKVDRVASNRRIIGPNGKVKATRTSATVSKAVRDEPEGLIDPWLKTLSFWHDDRPLAALHYYATHPMSYYGAGQVSSDFCGLARQVRQEEEPDVLQVYFNGCAGNVTAGKYNDGSHENRPILRDRMHRAMKAAWAATERQKLDGWDWRVEPVTLPPRTEPQFSVEVNRKELADPKQSAAVRGNAALELAWRMRDDRPIDVTCLDLGKALVVHLPGEPFVEYQLEAQRLRPDDFVCVAGYGDGGPGYIPVAESYAQGGYEPTVALSGPGSESILKRALATLLKGKS